MDNCAHYFHLPCLAQQKIFNGSKQTIHTDIRRSMPRYIYVHVCVRVCLLHFSYIHRLHGLSERIDGAKN